MAIFYPNAGALQKASNLKTSLANGKLHLFKSDFTPTVTTTLAELDAAECDFTGYPAGGADVVAWHNAILDPAGGASIESPLVQFEWASGAPDVTNLVGGWYYTTAGGMLIVATFPEPTPMEGPGQGIPIIIRLVEGSGQ